MKYYKGFNKDMTCRGFQFEEGKTYTAEGEAKLCENGFHACENPLDCFSYYRPDNAVYHEVELDGVSDERMDDSKVVAKSIKVGAELSVANICKAHFEYVKSKTTTNKQGRCNANLVGEDSSSLSARDWSSLSAQDSSSLSARNDSVLAAFNSKAKAGKGSLIVLANREWNGERYEVTDFAAAIVDGETIKENTWYICKDGKLVEWEGDKNESV